MDKWLVKSSSYIEASILYNARIEFLRASQMTDRYAVIGNPITHSKSPQIHRMFAEQTGQDISYEAKLAPLDDFAATIERLRNEGYKGCNVTVPFKSEAFGYAFHLHGIPTDRASTIKAVNTLKFDGETVTGDNTDGVGLVTDIKGNCNYPLKGKRVLLMGAGGAAWGVVQPIFREGVDSITIVNRNKEKAEEIQEFYFSYYADNLASNPELSKSEEPFIACSYDDLDGQQFDIVINATSSGLTDEMPPLPPGIFSPGALAYDMMYGRETPFMKFAREHGAEIVTDGLGMLVEQAAESFFIWRGVRPETAPVIAALRKQQ
jgi:shikimate dehydrogenase